MDVGIHFPVPPCCSFIMSLGLLCMSHYSLAVSSLGGRRRTIIGRREKHPCCSLNTACWVNQAETLLLEIEAPVSAHQQKPISAAWLGVDAAGLGAKCKFSHCFRTGVLPNQYSCALSVPVRHFSGILWPSTMLLSSSQAHPELHQLISHQG